MNFSRASNSKTLPLTANELQLNFPNIRNSTRTLNIIFLDEKTRKIAKKRNFHRQQTKNSCISGKLSCLCISVVDFSSLRVNQIGEKFVLAKKVSPQKMFSTCVLSTFTVLRLQERSQAKSNKKRGCKTAHKSTNKFSHFHRRLASFFRLFFPRWIKKVKLIKITWKKGTRETIEKN